MLSCSLSVRLLLCHAGRLSCSVLTCGHTIMLSAVQLSSSCSHTRLCNYTAMISCCHAVRSCYAAMLSCYHASMLVCCHTVIPCCASFHAGLMPYCLCDMMPPGGHAAMRPDCHAMQPCGHPGMPSSCHGAMLPFCQSCNHAPLPMLPGHHAVMLHCSRSVGSNSRLCSRCTRRAPAV